MMDRVVSGQWSGQGARGKKLHAECPMPHALCIILLTVHCSLSTVFTGCATAWAEETLKVGVIGPETGEEASLGLMTLAGVELAVKDVNDKGGIKGKKVEVIHLDIKGSGIAIQDAIARLIKEKVIAIIASPTGWSTFAPVWMVNEYRTIFVSAGSKRHIGRSGPYIFRMSLPDEIATEDTIMYCVRRLGYKRFALVQSMMDDEYSLALAGLYKRAVINKGGVVVSEVHIFQDANLKDVISTVKTEAKGPIDAIIFTGDAGSAIALLREARRQGLKAPLIGGEKLYRDEFLKAGKMVDGSILYSSFAMEDTSPRTVRFIESYKRKMGKSPTDLVALGYDSFMLVAKAIEDACTLDRVKIRDALTRVKDFQGVTGRSSIGTDGEAIKHPFILQVGKKGKGYGFSLVKD